MSKVKAKIEAKDAVQPAPSSLSVPGKSWDPADTSSNNNSDQPAYIPPVYATPKSYNPLMGQPIHEGGGESRPMFTSPLKEY